MPSCACSNSLSSTGDSIVLFSWRARRLSANGRRLGLGTGGTNPYEEGPEEAQEEEEEAEEEEEEEPEEPVRLHKAHSAFLRFLLCLPMLFQLNHS